jgi:hypothetical protein
MLALTTGRLLFRPRATGVADGSVGEAAVVEFIRWNAKEQPARVTWPDGAQTRRQTCLPSHPRTGILAHARMRACCLLTE